MASSCARVGSLFFLGIVRSSCLGVGARGRGWRLLPEGSNHRLGEPFPRLDVGDMGRRDGGRLYACAGEFLFESVHSIPFRWASLPFCLGAPARGRESAIAQKRRPGRVYVEPFRTLGTSVQWETFLNHRALHYSAPARGRGRGEALAKSATIELCSQAHDPIALPALHYSARPRGRGGARLWQNQPPSSVALRLTNDPLACPSL